MGCLEHTTYVQEMSSSYKISDNLKGRDDMRDLCINVKIILEHTLKKWGVMV